MIFSSNPLYNSLKIYIIIIIGLIYFKPEFIYDKKTKKFKQFGINKGNTIFSLPVLSILLAVVLYILFLWIDKLNNLSNINTQLIMQLNNQMNNQMNNQLNNQFNKILPIQIQPIQLPTQISTQLPTQISTQMITQ
jgi:hypothetical protein